MGNVVVTLTFDFESNRQTFVGALILHSCEDKNSKDSGQIIATSHDLTPNGGLVREIPLFQRKIQVGEKTKQIANCTYPLDPLGLVYLLI